MLDILIIGGLGFIGSNLAHALVKKGFKVTIIDAELDPYGWNNFNIETIKDKVEYKKVDIRHKDNIFNAVKGQDIIFNFAGQVSRLISLENPELDIDINILGSINVLEAVKIHSPNAKVIFAGSRGQTGEPVYLPVDEEHPDNPNDIYGINKLTAEKYHKLYFDVYGLKTTVFRINNVYGPRCQIKHGHYGVLNLFIGWALQDLPLTVFGDGSQTRDYIYIDDLIEAFIKVMNNPGTDGQSFQVGSGVETRFIDIVNIIRKTVGKGEIVHQPFPETLDKIDINRFVSSSEKLKNTTGWSPEISLDQGISRTVEYYRQNMKAYL